MTNPTKSPSYKPCRCGGECYLGTKEQPCWGQVEVAAEEGFDGDFHWVYACEGHHDMVMWQYDNDHPYVSEPKDKS